MFCDMERGGVQWQPALLVIGIPASPATSHNFRPPQPRTTGWLVKLGPGVNKKQIKTKQNLPFYGEHTSVHQFIIRD